MFDEGDFKLFKGFCFKTDRRTNEQTFVIVVAFAPENKNSTFNHPSIDYLFRSNTTTMTRGVGIREENPLIVLDRLLKGYDRRSTPLSGKGAATVVWTELYIASLGSINTDNMVIYF